MKMIFIILCFGMFLNVPACSGMFHVPGFIDALFVGAQLHELDLPPFQIAYVGVVSGVAELHPGLVNMDNIGIDETR